MVVSVPIKLVKEKKEKNYDTFEDEYVVESERMGTTTFLIDDLLCYSDVGVEKRMTHIVLHSGEVYIAHISTDEFEEYLVDSLDNDVEKSPREIRWLNYLKCHIGSI